MLRLLAITGLLVLVSAVLTLVTHALSLYLLTLILVISTLSIYGFLRRSLPGRTGTVKLSGLRETVEVYWDDRGIPHIHARNLHDLYLAQGYVTAQDHLWTMDLTRRAASGRLAEIFGAKALRLDKHFRTLGLRRAAEASWKTYSPEVQSYLEAYARGVNAWIAKKTWSPEFSLLRYRPEPWTPVDTLTIAKYVAYGLGGNWNTELFRLQLIQAVGAEKARELFWLPPDQELLEALEEIDLPELGDLAAIAAQVLGDPNHSSGLVVSGEKTATGKPLLAGEVQLPIRAPAALYHVHLTTGHGTDVTGVSFPGVPGVVIGHNQEIAWTVANLNADTQDLYVEKLNPEAPDQYLYRGRWEKADTIREEIRVRGQNQPVVHEVLITRHGPVLARNETTALALRWTALQPSNEVETVLALNRATSWSAFRETLRTYSAPALAFLFAGRDGTIAWRGQGAIPIRQKGDGQAPVPGWTGEYEWVGTIPFDELPEEVNPPAGFVTAANQDIAPAGYPHLLGSSWAPPYRAERMNERLRGAGNLTVEKIQQIQRDCVNLQARALLQPLLNALQEGLYQGAHPETLSEMEKRALLMLSGWDGNETPDSPAALLWHQWYIFLVEGIFRPQMGLTLFDQFVTSGMAVQVTDRLVQRVAAGEESLWLAREGEDGLPRIALRAFRRAVALLAAKYRPNPEQWRWGSEHTIRFVHLLTLGKPWLGPLLNLGPYRVGGSGNTIHTQPYSQLDPFQVSATGSWRQVVDLGRREESRDICAPGQSGHPLSPHHADQVSHWLKGEYQPQLLRQTAIRELPRMILRPAPAAESRSVSRT